MTTTAAQNLLVITNPHFGKGYRLGRLWYVHGEAKRVRKIDSAVLQTTEP